MPVSATDSMSWVCVLEEAGVEPPIPSHHPCHLRARWDHGRWSRISVARIQRALGKMQESKDRLYPLGYVAGLFGSV